MSAAASSNRDHRQVQPLWKLLMQRPLFVICASILVLIIAAVTFAPLIAPHSPTAQDLMNALSGPSAEHPLGTDNLGRDVLSRMLFGGRATLIGIVQALAVFLAVGVTLGLIAGMTRGVLDTLVTRAAELLLAVPAFILLLVVLSILPGNMMVAMVTLGILTSPLLIRVVRGTTRTIRNELFIRGARTMGLTEAQITFRHVLPRLAGPIIVQATIFCGVVVIAETGLGYLGFGVSLPAPSWGNMVQTASENITRAPWLLIPTGGVIIAAIMSFMFIGDSVRDAVADRWSGQSKRKKTPKRITNVNVCVALETAPIAQSLLEVKGLTIVVDTADGPETLVEDVTFSLAKGETLCLVGESGSGKSVTSLALLGLSRGTRVDSGSITVDGVDLSKKSPEAMRRLRATEFGYITQDPQPSLDPSMRIGDLLAQLVRLHQGVDKKASKQIVIELLERVQIPQPEAVAKRYPHQLSGGMAQRVVIAAALSANPKILIADEPTTALDVTVQAEILALLHELCAQDDSMALLLVTHDWGVVADIADRVIVMRNGKLLEEAKANDIFSAPSHPYTREMIAADPARLDIHSVRPAADKLVSIRGLAIEYQSRGSRGEKIVHRAVDGIDLDIFKGRTLGLIGESGSGKSSVGNTLVGLVEASAGNIQLFGNDAPEELTIVSTKRRRTLSKRLQIIFQDPYGSLNPVRTIGSTLTEPLVLAHGISQKLATVAVKEALERVGLTAAAFDKYPAQFSGGQRQRIAIARAIVLRPDVIVCDEPVSALDLTIQGQVLELLSELQEELDIAYLFISHDLSVVRSFCDDIAVMYRGKILETGTAAEVIGDPQHDYTKSLLDAAPIPDPTVQRGRSARAVRYAG